MWLRRVVGLCSSASRGWIAALTASRIGSRLLLLLTATIVASGDAKRATVVGLVAGGGMALQRLLQAGALAAVQRDLYRATARAFLDADALEIEEANPTREFMGGLYNAGRFLHETSPALLADIVVLAVVGPWMVIVSPPRFVAIVGVASLVLALASFAALRRTRRVETQLIESLRGVQEELFSAVDGRLEIVAAGRDRIFAARFEETLARYQRRVRRLGLTSALLGRAPIAAALVVVLGIVTFDADARDLLTRTFLSQALILAACVPSALGVAQGAHALTRARSQLIPFARLFEQPRRREEGREIVALPAPFVAERLSFAYVVDGPWVLSDLELRWEKGILAAVGANGSGKSTLLKLLLGLRSPQRGKLMNGGVEIAALDLRTWRAQIAYLPQRPYLGEPYITVRDSFRLAQPDASDEAILAELDAVGLRAMLHGRADILGTRVGELSAGQRQRLGFARILLQDAKLVILDEPDANLDVAGIQLVAAALLKMRSEGKMIAVAAHTQSLTAVADVVVDLANQV